MQLATQPIWLLLQFIPLAYIAWTNPADIEGWTGYSGKQGNPDGTINWMLFAMAASILLSLLPQIGEQVDYLRFLPNKRKRNRVGWWTAVLTTGPGWVFLGAFKLLAGSFLAYLALQHGVPIEHADDPTEMYFLAFKETLQSPTVALVLTGIFVIVCQTQDQRHECVCGLDRMVEFFLAPDAHASRPRRLARLQCLARAVAHGNGHLSRD